MNKNVIIGKRYTRMMRKWLDTNGLAQHDLAHYLGVSETVISRWLNERNYPSRAWRQIIDAKIGDAVGDNVKER